CRPDVARFVRVLPGIDHDDTLLGENDAAVRFEAPAGVNVDAVGELLDLRTGSLRAGGPREHARGNNGRRARPLLFHGFVSLEMATSSKPQLMFLVPCDAMPGVARIGRNRMVRLSASAGPFGQPKRSVRPGRENWGQSGELHPMGETR